ncbi:HTH-type transcriptional repressor PurR [bioreactor metagenome]|uniref:HTH-type transcriptional repressor PurR n=1 Tax=bioreactor metagenome TaxID=1076179 RepID=A0A645G1C8_9ZZZZ
MQPASREESHFLESVDAGIPVVSLEETANERISFVKGNDYRTAYNLTTECIRQGHRNIAFATFQFDSIGLNERVRGFQDAIAEAKIAGGCKVITTKDLSLSAAEASFKDMERKFSLILCSDDRLACRLLQVLAKQQVRIPDEISLVGWNNSRFLGYLTLPLSSVSIPMDRVGRKAAAIILANLNGNQVVRKNYIAEEIVFRESFTAKDISQQL